MTSCGQSSNIRINAAARLLSAGKEDLCNAFMGLRLCQL